MREVWSKNRQDVKVGRGSRALLKSAGIKDISDKDYETFVNLFKATIDKLNDKFSYFEVVKGDDIHYWYDSDRYFERRGTLGSSCMSSADEDWLEIYTSNPEKVNLVIFKSQDDDTKIIGRALLWTLNDGKRFMDRIYTVNDSDVNLFREFAKENGWYSKYQNGSSDSGRCNAPDGATVDLDLTVNLGKSSYTSYPYLDTLKYFKEGSGILSNSKRGDAITLEDTEGGYVSPCECCGGSGSVECCDCYGRGSHDCSECDGDGEVDCSECNASGRVTDDEGNEVECSECDGDGEVKCSNCSGSGREDCDECNGRGEVRCYEC
jgi:hypothetical protein